MKSTFLVTITSEYEISPISIERVLLNGFITSVEEVTVKESQYVAEICPECQESNGYHKTNCSNWLWEPPVSSG